MSAPTHTHNKDLKGYTVIESIILMTYSSPLFLSVIDFWLIPTGTAELLQRTKNVSAYSKNHASHTYKVYQAIYDCHAAVHAKGAPRVATDIRIGTRVDRDIPPAGGNDGEVKRVEEILARD
ncbi:hypothetical protein DXG01_005944 [Tephrocybe rancida]|nr:hypothetical protein DXG01_005944 [Tephrocybe rancida]